jgi:hypothetical protein
LQFRKWGERDKRGGKVEGEERKKGKRTRGVKEFKQERDEDFRFQFRKWGGG